MSTQLDNRDLEILRILSREGRISKTELAKRVNLSPTPCWERLKRLEDSGLIRGYRADIELSALGPSVTIFVTVELERHRSQDFRAFEAAVAPRDEVTACWALGGGFDYILQVTTKDVDTYQRFIDELLRDDLGLARYFTYIVTSTVKSNMPSFAILDGAQKK
ncbi:MAG: Lrp/AsnC family transcriptional regulator [Pseudomonadota bacterium]